MADETEQKGGHKKKQLGRAAHQAGQAARFVRSRVGQVIWVLAVIAALLLAAGALLVVLEANEQNSLVSFVLDAAERLDLGVFDRTEGIKQFTNDDGSPDLKVNALFNWGLGAVAWLLAGRIVSGIIRP